jgi:hypothetical protein
MAPLSNAERQARYRKRIRAKAQMAPEAVAAVVRQWVEELAAAWSEMQPEPEPWADYIAKTQGDALEELARPDQADNESQREALRRVRLILDALALRN